MQRASRPITVTLGKLQERVETRVRSGTYSSASEVLRAAIRALDREDAAIKSYYKSKIEESISDLRPDIAAETVFADLRKHHAKEGNKRRK